MSTGIRAAANQPPPLVGHNTLTSDKALVEALSRHADPSVVDDLHDLGALAGREWYHVGRFLGPSISAHYDRYSDAWTIDAWERAGISDVGIRLMSLGGGVVMWGRRTDG